MIRPLFFGLIFLTGLNFTAWAAQPSPEVIWQSLNSKAGEYYQQGDYRKAEESAKQALNRAEKEFGLESSQVASSINSLAMIYYAKGSFTDAESLHKRALALRE